MTKRRRYITSGWLAIYWPEGYLSTRLATILGTVIRAPHASTPRLIWRACGKSPVLTWGLAMKVHEAVEQDVAHKRSLGMQCQTMARQLRAFCKASGDVNVNAVGAETAQAFIYSNGPITSNLHGKFHVLRGFYRYLLSRGYVTSSPLPVQIPRKPERLIPYIYSRAELHCLLQAAQKESHWCKFEPVTMRTRLLLLYGAGLRISEALRLTLRDVDLEQRLLTIRETKFYKTRLVPLSADRSQALTKRHADVPLTLGRALMKRRGSRSPICISRRQIGTDKPTWRSEVTVAARQCPLWPATVREIENSIGKRLPHEHVFLTRLLRPYTRVVSMSW